MCIPLKWQNAFSADNDWNLSKYTLAQLWFLLLFSCNYLVACAWAAFVQGRSITDTSTPKSSSDDVFYAWAYVVIAFVLTYIFVFIVQGIRRTLFHLDYEEFERKKQEELSASSSSSSSSSSSLDNSERKSTLDTSAHPIEPIDAETERKVHVVASPPQPEFAPKASPLKSELLTKVTPPKPVDWKLRRRKIRTLWFDKISTNVGQGVMFLTAVAFHGAVQMSVGFSDSDAKQVLYSWIYALLLSAASIPIKTYFAIRLKKKQIQVKSEKAFRKIKHHLMTTKLASWRWMTMYIQGFLSNIMALAYAHAVVSSIQLESVLGWFSIVATWGYTLALLCGVVLLITQLEDRRNRLCSTNIDIETENLNLVHNIKVEIMNLTENTSFLMAVFAIPYAMDLTTSFFAEAPNIAVLGVYALLITFVAALFIVWVQYKLFCATWEQQLCNERRLEEKSRNSSVVPDSTNLEAAAAAAASPSQSPFAPSMSTISTASTTPSQTRGFHKIIANLTHDNIFLHLRILLPTFTYWSHMARIAIQGMGLTVAYAWNTFFVSWLILKETKFTRWSLFGYACGITLIAAFLITITTTSNWLKSMHIRVYKPSNSERNLSVETGSQHGQHVDTNKNEMKDSVGIAIPEGKQLSEKSKLVEEEHKKAKRKRSIEMNLPLAFERGKGYGYRPNMVEEI